jgi:mannosyl-3-phosphoglycerate synthase
VNVTFSPYNVHSQFSYAAWATPYILNIKLPFQYATHISNKEILGLYPQSCSFIMRLEIRPNFTRVGNVEIYETFCVNELDAGHRVDSKMSKLLESIDGPQTVPFSQESLFVVEAQLAIIIPCMNEEPNILDGVLHGVPHECLIILVSNSDVANFTVERELLRGFCTDADRPGIAVHQGDEGIAQAFLYAGIPELIDIDSRQEKLRVRHGKGEAMMIGTVIAKLAGKQFVGFIDADNNVPGSVHEYCKVYAAGLAFAQSDFHLHAMIRIKWNSKPKVEDGKLVFKQSGRCSRVVNEWMNRLLVTLASEEAKTDPRIIQTANAGEHAMSLDLAMELHFATGYAVEPLQLVDAWEQFGTDIPIHELALDANDNVQPCLLEALKLKAGGNTLAFGSSSTSTSDCNDSPTSTLPTSVANSPRMIPALPSRPVRILQVQTRNPHIHDISKGEEHIQRMQVQGLSTIYHSRLTPQKLKEELRTYMKQQFPILVAADGEPEKARVYPSISTMDFGVFRQIARGYADTLMVVGKIDWEI